MGCTNRQNHIECDHGCALAGLTGFCENTESQTQGVPDAVQKAKRGTRRVSHCVASRDVVAGTLLGTVWGTTRVPGYEEWGCSPDLFHWDRSRGLILEVAGSCVLGTAGFVRAGTKGCNAEVEEWTVLGRRTWRVQAIDHVSIWTQRREPHVNATSNPNQIAKGTSVLIATPEKLWIAVDEDVGHAGGKEYKPAATNEPADPTDTRGAGMYDQAPAWQFWSRKP